MVFSLFLFFIFCIFIFFISNATFQFYVLCVFLHLAIRFTIRFVKTYFLRCQVSSPILTWISMSTGTRTTPAILLQRRWRLRRFGYWQTIPRDTSSSQRVSQKLRHQRERTTYNFVRGGERRVTVAKYISCEISTLRVGLRLTLRNESCRFYTRVDTFA